MKAFFRGSLATLVGSVALFSASTAFADGEPCINDTDCPGNGMTCGGDVCNWTKMHPTASGMFTCNAAGSQTPVGHDGWCTTVDNCKCKGEGATCVAPYSTFTKPQAGGTGGTGAGGSPAGGSPSTTAGTTSTTAGMTSTTAGTTSTTAGTASTPAASSDSGGCSVSGPIGTRGGAALALGVLGLGFALSRRRR